MSSCHQIGRQVLQSLELEASRQRPLLQLVDDCMLQIEISKMTMNRAYLNAGSGEDSFWIGTSRMEFWFCLECLDR